MISIDTRDAIREIRKNFGTLTDSRVNLAIARAINDALVTARKSGVEQARVVYNIKSSDLKKDMATKKADRLTLTGRVLASQKGMPVVRFAPRERKDGISIQIKKGKREVIKSAFFAQGKASGSRFVFARGKYGADQFKFRKQRIVKSGPDLPIGNLKTISALNALTNTVVQKKLEQDTSTQFTKRLVHHLSRAQAGLSASAPTEG